MGQNSQKNRSSTDEPVAMDLNKARNYALRRLALGALTCKQLRDALKKREAPDEVIDQVMVLMEGYGYLDDRAWAEGFVRGQRRKGVGPHVIRYKLRQKGISEEIAGAFLEKAHEGQKEQIEAYLAKKRPDLADPKVRQKTAAALHRKGFDSESIRNALNLNFS